MTRKKYEMIPVVISVILIPQLLFHWLAPVEAAARLPVYVGGSILTAFVPTALFFTYCRCGLRSAVGTAIVSGVLETVTLCVCIALLAFNATVRSAVFSLVILALVHLICLVPMIGAALAPRVREVVMLGALDPENRNSQKPLPPRNR